MLKNYLKITIKVLKRNVYYTFLSITGIGVTLMLMLVAVALIDAVTGPRPPELKTDRLLVNSSVMIKNGEETKNGGPGYYLYRNSVAKLDLPMLTSHFTYSGYIRVLAGSKSSWGNLIHTDDNYWQILDYKYLSGFPFSRSDFSSGSKVAVVNRKIAESLYGTTDAVGKPVRISSQNYTICGVVENSSNYREVSMGDIFIPITTDEKRFKSTSMTGFGHKMLVLAENKDDKNKIRKELEEFLASQYITGEEEYEEIICQLDTPFQHFVRNRTGDAGKRGMGLFAFTLLIVSLLFMLIPTVNMVNINLSRIFERQCEIGVRKAFGATQGELIVQFLSENVFITALSGLFGLAGAAILIWFINQSGSVPGAMDLQINFLFFSTALIFILIFGLLSGVFPAMRISKLQIAEALKGGRL
jgi:putative ABC transport system permease protein